MSITIQEFYELAGKKLKLHDYIIKYIDKGNQIGYVFHHDKNVPFGDVNMPMYSIYSLTPDLFMGGEINPYKMQMITIICGNNPDISYAIRDKRGFMKIPDAGFDGMKVKSDFVLDDIKFKDFEELGIILNRFYNMMLELPDKVEEPEED